MSDEGKPSSNEAESPSSEASGGLAYEQARLAYTIIQSLLEHTRVT